MTATPRPTDRVLVETFAVGERMCTLSLPLGASGLGTMTVEWSPDAPRRLTDAERAEYRLGRHRLLQRAAGELGGSIVVVE